ncbi:flagellar hook-basal body complex protein FliE [Nitratireductor indicus]|uniref:Flagellar hook-basal body complex protein FliE n=1 Tax=Nitratireductor indicus C115 TaxID=1231190 RepID=K2NQD1_9HYPH|nr:flagellar hook-basal body complex protein FliE [Nitratireductor indicus]EKF41565.1 flagellar hook-basal body protein FliE [Nitratireductor indicus C115]MDS1136093.1 flagellar hook-basal body complex protein FliE [Nitratireductor indicus]SFQ70069.1 flagellar hook-basal body complex protein FliE [Nitratireductor indicus]
MIPPVGTIAPSTLTNTTGLQAARPVATSEIGESFSAMLGEAAANTAAKLGHAESVSLKALQGEADAREVVDAVMTAEQALQAAIAIRDKFITSYLEISRMAI